MTPERVTPSYTDDPVLVERVAVAMFDSWCEGLGIGRGRDALSRWGPIPSDTKDVWRASARATLDQEPKGRCTVRSVQGSQCALTDGHTSDHCWEHADLAEYGGEPPPESAESSEPCPATGGQHVLARDGSYCLECGAIRPTPLSESGEA